MKFWKVKKPDDMSLDEWFRVQAIGSNVIALLSAACGAFCLYRGLWFMAILCGLSLAKQAFFKPKKGDA